METEKAALRNSAIVGALFSITTAIRNLRKRSRGKGPPRNDPIGGLPPLEKLGDWEEAYRSALGVGGTTEVYGLIKRVLGKHAAAVGSLVPLRLTMDDPRLRLNYKFLVAFAVGQAIIQLIPFFKKSQMLVMILSTSQLLSSWLYSDKALPRDYYAFLYSQGHISRERLLQFRDLTFSPTAKNKEYKPFCWPKKEGGQWEFDENKPLEAARAFAQYFMRHMQGSVPFYVKVYALRLVYFWVSGKSNTQVHTRVTGMIKDVMRSSIFLSSYCTLAYLGVYIACVTMPERNTSPLIMWALLGISGLGLLVETPSQQRTISSYCATFGAYPILEYFGIFDHAAVASSLLASTGVVRTSIPFRLMWGDDTFSENVKAKKALEAAKLAK
eukprot:TRINITY_DN13439_c0_g1_i1.p1 TRINITY_DN13439_c0_g1~~TRINITY_DN13439_c0_g1_i1.p1  ORF type:complete len:384 (+),score=61.44 TRINITY_DN13439_c0_g1_i1:43-1194(+)